MLLAVLMMFTTVDISAFAHQGEVVTEVDIAEEEIGTEEETEISETETEENKPNIPITYDMYDGEKVYIHSSNQIVDTITYNGINVNAIYRPYDGTNGEDSTYSCAAFVSRFYNLVFGIQVSNLWSSTSTPMASDGYFSVTDSPNVGDILRSNNSTHWGIVKAVNGSELTIIQQNAWLDNRKAAWVNAKVSVTDSKYTFFRWSKMSSHNDPIGHLDHISGMTGQIYMNGWALDKDLPTTPLAIHVYVGSGDDREFCAAFNADVYREDVAKAFPGTGTNHGFEQYIYTDKSGYQQVDVFAINIGGGTSNTWLSSTTVYIPPDTTKPTVHNAYVYHYDANSYTVVATASDDVALEKVEFATFYENQQISDTKWYKGHLNPNDGSYYYTIDINDFGGKEGTYHTHVYAWDYAGNSGVYCLSQCIDRTAPTITEKKAERISENTVKISCKTSDNTGAISVYFPTWTESNGQDDLKSDWETYYKGKKEGDWWVYYVYDYDHNYEKGNYITQIHPYDAYNNHSQGEISFSFENLFKSYSFSYDEHTYELFDALLTWEEAKAKCEELGGHLVTINSQEEQIAIEEALRKGVRGNYYLGGKTEKNQYVWITGEAFTYSNWAVNEPNNYAGEQGYYVIKKSTNKWDDVNKLQKYGFICEYEPDAVIPTDKPGGTIPNGFWIAGVDEAGYTYTGSAIKPSIRVYDKDKRLELNKDYTITYKNNTKVNDASVEKTAPTIIVKGKGNYTKQETVTFKILPKNITDFDIVISNPIRKENRKTQKVVPTITRNGKKLANKKDFTVEYPDTMAGAYKVPGTYNIVVKGKGGYSGQKTITYTITENVLMSSVSVSKIKDQVYTGSTIKPALTVKKGTTPLVEGMDYKVSYSNNKEIGTATIILTGMGKYSGEKKVTFKIKGVAINKAKISGVPKQMVYTGSAITYATSEWGTKPTLTISIDGTDKVLTEGTDYTVSYQKNINKGTASIIFTGKNGYSGTLKKTFQIKPYNIFDDLSGKIMVSFDENQVYAKGGSKPKPVVKFGSTMLVEGKDYTLSYKNNNKVNDRRDPNKLPIVTINGKGNYTASISKSFTIVKQSLANLTISAPDKVYSKTKGAFKSIPKITDLNNKNLSAGTDFEKNYVYTYKHDVTLDNGTVRRAGEVVGATDIVPAGTILRVTVTGKGNYADSSITGEYRITKSSITKATVKVASQTYTGKEIKPDKSQITVKIGKQVLTTDDYDIVSYSNNIKKGTAKVTIKGKGNYGGTKTVNFTIKSKGFLWWWR